MAAVTWFVVPGVGDAALVAASITSAGSFGVSAAVAILGIVLVVFGVYFVWSLRHPAAAAVYKRKLEALRVSVEGANVEDERSD